MQKQTKKTQSESPNSRQKAIIAPRMARCKAFLVDLFLLYVPICYVCYFVLGSKEAFLGNQAVIFFCSAFFGVIQAVFFSARAQSPGLRAYELYVIDKNTGQKISFLRAILRYTLFLISAALLFGLLLSFLRKDRLALHDVLSQSCIVRKV